MSSKTDITLRLLESAANDPEAELLLEARDEIERLRAHIREQAAELERVRYELDATRHARETIRAQQQQIESLLEKLDGNLDPISQPNSVNFAN